MLADLDLTSIQDERARQCIILLLTLVEDLKQENQTLREELQRLRDEINRLKGEQGKPTIKPATKPDVSASRAAFPLHHAYVRPAAPGEQVWPVISLSGTVRPS